jgi:hypothetical protein
MRDTSKALIPCILCLCVAGGCTGSKGAALKRKVGARTTSTGVTTAQFATVDG